MGFTIKRLIDINGNKRNDNYVIQSTYNDRVLEWNDLRELTPPPDYKYNIPDIDDALNCEGTAEMTKKEALQVIKILNGG